MPLARAGQDIGDGVVVLDVDSTIVLAHSDKDGAAPTHRSTFELLAVKLRPGNAGANTAADHLDVLGDAFTPDPRRTSAACTGPW